MSADAQLDPQVLRDALQWIRNQKKKNPFSNFAEVQNVSSEFEQAHYPGLFQTERELLWTAIDSYRVPKYDTTSDIPASRIITIRGPRGAGKTHLMHSLAFRPDGKTQLICRPKDYSDEIPDEVYFLEKLQVALFAQHPFQKICPYDLIAEEFTRRLLIEAIRRLDPVFAIFATSPSSTQRLKYAVSRSNQSNQQFRDLATKLADENEKRSVRQLIQSYDIRPEHALRLITGHIRIREPGRSSTELVRRYLYEASAKWTLFDDKDTVQAYFDGDWGDERKRTLEITQSLLESIIEACALVDLPIVFAFDNAEQLFRTKSGFDAELFRAFRRSLAQGVDNTRGILFLLFMESGLYDRYHSSAQADEFADGRWIQKIDVPGRSFPYRIDLNPPSESEVREFVSQRLKPLWEDFPRKEELPLLFPFSEAFQQRELTSRTAPLRTVLIQLNEEYERSIYSQEPYEVGEGPPPPPPPPPPNELWNAHFQKTVRTKINPLSQYRTELHSGLFEVCSRATSWNSKNWTLQSAGRLKQIGENTKHGFFTMLEWLSNPTGKIATVCIGLFLVDRSQAILTDLESKFDVFSDQNLQVHHLIILWPKAEGKNPESTLPQKTKGVWNKNPHPNRTSLRPFTKNHAYSLLTFPAWLAAIEDKLSQPASDSTVQTVIQERFNDFLQTILPPDSLHQENV